MEWDPVHHIITEHEVTLRTFQKQDCSQNPSVAPCLVEKLLLHISNVSQINRINLMFIGPCIIVIVEE